MLLKIFIKYKIRKEKKMIKEIIESKNDIKEKILNLIKKIDKTKIEHESNNLIVFSIDELTGDICKKK